MSDRSLPIRYYPEWARDIAYQNIVDQIHWEQEHLTFFGKSIKVPRLVAFYGDTGISYTYSGNTHKANSWTVLIEQLKQRLQAQFYLIFNSALCNFYHGGQDHMGWHADNETALGPLPTIASLSFGGSRDFLFKHRTTEQRQQLTLHHGDLLIMDPPCQEEWLHCLPKRARQNTPRVNITLRNIQV